MNDNHTNNIKICSGKYVKILSYLAVETKYDIFILPI